MPLTYFHEIAPLPSHSAVEKQKKPPTSSGSGSSSGRFTPSSQGGASPPPPLPQRSVQRLSVGSITSPLVSPVSSQSTGTGTGTGLGLDTLHEVKRGRLSELEGDFPMAELSGGEVRVSGGRGEENKEEGRESSGCDDTRWV